jgi:hypothetical protein
LKYPLVKICFTVCLISGFTSALFFSDLATAQSNEVSEVAPSPALEGKRSPEISSAKHVDDALVVVRQLESDATMRKLLQDASGVFIVPTYGRAALGIGAHGGAGVLLVKKASGNWTNPVFYNIGGISRYGDPRNLDRRICTIYFSAIGVQYRISLNGQTHSLSYFWTHLCGFGADSIA